MTYLQVVDKNAGNKETFLEVLSWLYKEFKVGKLVEHLIVAICIFMSVKNHHPAQTSGHS